MPSKKLSALIAMALLGASTAGVAQTASRPIVAPEPATERLSTEDGSALGGAEAVGVAFGLLAIVILIWKLGNKDKLTANPFPLSP